jgi:TonB family protein
MLKKLLLAAIVVFVSAPLFAQTPPPDHKGAVVVGDRVPAQPSSGGVLNGKAVKLPKPVYPREARAARVQGPVTVQVLIDEEGRVISAAAVSGDPLLHDTAVTAAKGAIFSPTVIDGKPVKVSGVITYNFVLDTPAAAGSTKTELKQPTYDDLIMMLGMILSMIQANDSDFREGMGGGPRYAELLKSLAADPPEGLKTEQALFDELAKANESERPPIAGRLSEAIRKHLNSEQQWRSDIGERLGSITMEFMRLAKNGPPPAGARLDVSLLQSRLKLLNDSVAAAPPGAPPDLVAKLRNIASYSDSKDLGVVENFVGLWKAFGEFVDLIAR